MPDLNFPDDVFFKAARLFDTPFYLYDEKGMIDSLTRWQQAFRWAPRFKQYYAVKALPNPAILKIMLDHGAGLDCSSESELYLADKLGVAGPDIMFSANAMPAIEMKMARDMGAHINLDDLTDVPTLLSFGAPPDTVCLRLNPGGTFGVNNHIMGTPEDSKFGMREGQALTALETLKDAGLKAFGLHAFLASNVNDDDYYGLLADYLLAQGLRLQELTGLTFSYINLSGGVGIPYHPEDQAPDFERVGQGVKRAYEKRLGKAAQATVGIKTELGRAITGPHGFLLSRVLHKKDTWKRHIGLDAHAGNLIRPAMYGAYHHITVPGKDHLPLSEEVDVTGALCENNDKFAIDRPLPPLDIGDLLVLHDAGAHAHAMGYQYNGRLRSAEVLYRADGRFQLIRRAETIPDYLSTVVWE